MYIDIVHNYLDFIFDYITIPWFSYLKFDINAIYAEHSVVIVLVDAYLALFI
jgi:hypothetical protein